MDNIKVDQHSLYTINADIIRRYVGTKSINTNSRTLVKINKIRYEIFNGEDLINADLVDLHLFILTTTGYENYVICNSYIPINDEYKACIYKIIKDDNTTDNNIQNLDGE